MNCFQSATSLPNIRQYQDGLLNTGNIAIPASMATTPAYACFKGLVEINNHYPDALNIMFRDLVELEATGLTTFLVVQQFGDHANSFYCRKLREAFGIINDDFSDYKNRKDRLLETTASNQIIRILESEILLYCSRVFHWIFTNTYIGTWRMQSLRTLLGLHIHYVLRKEYPHMEFDYAVDHLKLFMDAITSGEIIDVDDKIVFISQTVLISKQIFLQLCVELANMISGL